MMKYNNADVRRRDRLLNEERALELLRESEYCVLSMIDEEGKPYGFPINHIWDGGDCIYVHCAPEGKKLRAIRAGHAEVSLCIVGRVNLLPSKFTTEYESVILEELHILVSAKRSAGMRFIFSWRSYRLMIWSWERYM